MYIALQEKSFYVIYLKFLNFVIKNGVVEKNSQARSNMQTLNWINFLFLISLCTFFYFLASLNFKVFLGYKNFYIRGYE